MRGHVYVAKLLVGGGELLEALGDEEHALREHGDLLLLRPRHRVLRLLHRRLQLTLRGVAANLRWARGAAVGCTRSAALGKKKCRNGREASLP